MRSAILTALLFFTSCGSGPDITSKHGVKFYLNDVGTTWTKESIDNQEDWLLDQLELSSSMYPRSKTVPTMTRVEVKLESKSFSCPTFDEPNRACNGLQTFNVLRVTDRGCVYNSAYLHELFHWFQLAVNNENDYNHTSNLWSIADSFKTDSLLNKCR